MAHDVLETKIRAI